MPSIIGIIFGHSLFSLIKVKLVDPKAERLRLISRGKSLMTFVANKSSYFEFRNRPEIDEDTIKGVIVTLNNINYENKLKEITSMIRQLSSDYAAFESENNGIIFKIFILFQFTKRSRNQRNLANIASKLMGYSNTDSQVEASKLNKEIREDLNQL